MSSDKIKVRTTLYYLILCYVFISALLWIPTVISTCPDFIVYLYNYSHVVGLFLIFLYLIIMIIENKKIYFDSSCFFVLLFGIYSALITIYRNGFTIQMWKMCDILIWPFLYFISFDYFRLENKLNQKVIKFISIIFIFIFSLLSINNIILHLSGQGDDGGVIFPIYTLLFFLPFYFYFVKKSKIIMIIISIIIIFTTKRAGLLALALGLLLYYCGYIINEKTLTKKNRRFFILITVSVSMLVMFIFIVNVFNLNIFERFMNLYEDGGSGRDLIWELIINDFQNSTAFEKFFGHGYHTTAIITGESIINREILAHNDCIEILYDYGILGLIIVSLWIICLLKNIFVFILSKSKHLPVYLYLISSMSIISVFSYFMVQSKIILFAVIVFGAINSKAKLNYVGEICEKNRNNYN